ncbi:MAG: hypothetical protein RLZZ165_1417 [Bacteroidota bacterium]|jgi:predicted DCC family thiol-disulfide oxidoreductase YuxK
MDKAPEPPVLIFDGVCELCNASVDFILKWEKQPELRFTASQNPPGRSLLQRYGEDPDAVSTVFLVQDGKLYRRSTAVLRLARMLRFPWFLAYGFIVVPPPIRDFVYRIIANNRYRWFGKKSACRIPTPVEMARFMLE